MNSGTAKQFFDEEGGPPVAHGAAKGPLLLYQGERGDHGFLAPRAQGVVRAGIYRGTLAFSASDG